MKREEWKGSYKRICCLLAAIGAGTALCGCSPGNGTQAVRHLAEVRFPAEPVYKNSEERWEAERNQSLPEAFLAAYSDFSYGTAAELLKDKKENTAYSPLGLYYALAAAAQGAEGKTEEEFLSLLGYDSVRSWRRTAKAPLRSFITCPIRKTGQEPERSPIPRLSILFRSPTPCGSTTAFLLKEAFGRTAFGIFLYGRVPGGSPERRGWRGHGRLGEGAHWRTDPAGAGSTSGKCAAFFKEYHLFLRSVAGPVFSGDHRGGCVLYG